MDRYLPAVHRALAFVEENLTAPLTLEAVARRAGYSLWHFQRIFAAYTGESLAAYLRRRRLTVAVLALRNTRRRILDIALDHQFESHAAFTRAFQATFRATPSSFRRSRRPVPPEPTLRRREAPSTMNPKPTIEKHAAMTLLGLEARFLGPMSPDANNHTVIPPLFARFFARAAELPAALDGCCYGATRAAPKASRTREDELVYLAGRRVPDGVPVPAGMTVWRVPARTYAAFEHRGPIVRIDETLGHIFGVWLPQSDFELAEDFSLERYDERFGDGGENSAFDLLVPVEPRSRRTPREA